MKDTTWRGIEAKASRIRKDLLPTMADTARRQGEWKLPAAPPGFVRAMTALGNPEYDIVVCGEVKRGKSSFINALIGQPLLPTGVRGTTWQVLRIAKLRLIEILGRAGAQRIEDEKGFDVAGHQVWPAARVSQGSPIIETIEPGLGLGNRVFKRARVRVQT